jgi:hypothetical protein
MKHHKRYEILNGLPGHGPMYIPVSEDDEQFYSEGFVVRFYKSDGSDWVANFKTGWSNLNFVFDYPEIDRIIVIAKGQGYIMDPNQEKPIETFGLGIKSALVTKENEIVLVDDISIEIMTEKGIVWQSERISWDGIKDTELNGNILSGLSYDPTNSFNEWIPFTVDLTTKEIIGGSYRQ